MRFCWALVFCLLTIPFDGALGRGVAGLQKNALHHLELRVEGPLRGVQLSCGQAGKTLWRGEIMAGESRTLRLPVPLSATRREELRIQVEGAGTAELVGWLPPVKTLPRFLQSRSLSGPVPMVRRLGWSATLLLVAAGVAVLGLRRRPSWALGVGSLGALALVFCPGPPELGGGILRVFEGQGDGGTPRWLRTDAGVGALEVDGSATLLRVLSAARGQMPLTFTVEESLGGEDRSIGAEAPAGTRLAASWAPARSFGALTQEVQGFGPLEQVWTRGVGEATPDLWVQRGPWALGMPLPEVQPGLAPPGWLSWGLPQGRGILLAKVAPGGPGWAVEGAVPESVWLRLVGFGE
jgi:hypothetical protein